MAIEVVMPRLGWTMETGKIAEWLKKDGDTVQAGEIVFTVESDKAVQEVEALDSGILRISPAFAVPGAEAPVGGAVAYLVQHGEPAPFEAEVPAPPPSHEGVGSPPPSSSRESTGALLPGREEGVGASHSTAPGTPTGAPPAGVLHASGATPAISPRALRVARELGVDWQAIIGSGRTGRIVERDVRAQAAISGSPRGAAVGQARVTPVARRLAQEAGIDVDELAASMPGQRIGRADVEVAAGAMGSAPMIPAAPRDGQVQPAGTVRRIIATRMAHSAHTVAPVSLTTEADATELVRLRTRLAAALRDSGRRVPSYNDLLARLAALALLEHPWMNASWSDDGIIQHDAVHMGFAVDTAKGLVVPVVRDVQRKAVQQIAEESARLVEHVRAGGASPDDLRGGTFTITNLGMYEIDAFTPIINLPECAILGVGRIVARPVVIDEDAGEIAVRKMMTLSLTFDHRVVDGAPAARFLQHVKRWVEEPYGWLAS